MKTESKHRHHNRSAGSSIAETIGVMAIIGVLAASICPKVMQALQDAQVVAEVTSIKGLKNAMESYYQQHGKLAGLGGAAITNWTNLAFDNWDREVLAKGGYTADLFRTRLGSISYVRLTKANPTANSIDIDNGPIKSENRGTLGNIRANNGIYDLTKEYSAVRPPHYSEMGAHSGTRGSGFHSALRVCSFSSGKPLTGPLLGVAALGECAEIATALATTTLGHGRLGGRMGAILSRNKFANNTLRACYPMDNGRKTPTPGYGGGGSGSGASYADNVNNRKTHNDASAGDCGVVAELVIDGISIEDAYRLSVMLDGTSQSNWAYWDSLGRVKYDFYDVGTRNMKTNRRGVIFIYLGHGD